jgi:hypothetical protein
MTRARRFAFGVIALVAIGMVPAAAAGESAFEGVYIANGVDADGIHYRRAVNIERDGDKFRVTWVSARIVGEAIILEPTWVGVGIAIGDTLSVGFVAGDTFGIMVYQAGADGQPLSGRWAIADDDGAVQLETLTRLPDLVPESTTVDPPEEQRRPSSARAAGKRSL